MFIIQWGLGLARFQAGQVDDNDTLHRNIQETVTFLTRPSDPEKVDLYAHYVSATGLLMDEATVLLHRGKQKEAYTVLMQAKSIIDNYTYLNIDNKRPLQLRQGDWWRLAEKFEIDLGDVFAQAQRKRENGYNEEALKDYDAIQEKAGRLQTSEGDALVADCIHMKILSHTKRGHFLPAYELAQQAEKAFIKIGKRYMLGAVYRDSGDVARTQGLFEIAERNYTESIALLLDAQREVEERKPFDANLWKEITGQLGVSYAKQGRFIGEQGNNQLGLFKIRIGLDMIRESAENTYFEAKALQYLAERYVNEGDYEEAKKAVTQAVQIYDVIYVKEGKEFLQDRSALPKIS